MKNRITKFNNGFIGKNNANKKIAEGIVGLNQKNTLLSENYNISGIDSLPYSPPSAWRSLPSFSGITQGFAGVFAIYNNDSNFVTLQMDTSAGNYIVNWGDGTTGSFTDNQIAYKRYTSGVYSGLTSDVYLGYKTVVIEAYPVSGRVLQVVLTNAHNQTGFNANYNFPWLNVQIAGSSATNVALSGLVSLEQVNFIGQNSITSNVTRFSGCRGLKKVVNWDTSLCTTFHQMFRNCNSLIECPPLNTRSAAVGTNNFTYMFEGCYSMRYVPWFDTSKATSMDNMFDFCYSLTAIPPFNTSNVTSMNTTFFACHNLEELPWMDTSKVTNFGSIIRSCYKMKKFPNFNMSSATNIAYPFGNMYNIREIPFLDTSNVTDHYEMFARDNAIVKLPDTMNISKSTRMGSAFYECSGIRTLPRFIRDGSRICTMDFMCYVCENLESIPSFNTDKISTFNGAFINNWQLKDVGFTFYYPVGQTWATSTVFNSTFQECRSLKSIGISDVSGISGSTYTTAYASMFANCFRLSEVGLSGISENFSILNCALGSTALNDLYNRLATVGASGAGAKTLTITGNWGATGSNRSIAIGKGWNVAG